MSFIKNLFLKIGNSKSRSPEPPNGFPLKEKVNFVHIKRTEILSEELQHVYFHFPNYEMEAFGIEIAKGAGASNKIIKSSWAHNTPMDKIRLFSKYNTHFHIGLISEASKGFLVFGAYLKEIKFNVDDTISIQFEDDETWEFVLTEKGHRAGKDQEGSLSEVKIEVSEARLQKLANQPLKKWRYQDFKSESSHTNFLDAVQQRNLCTMGLMIQIGMKEL